jgi:hypothetical protein
VNVDVVAVLYAAVTLTVKLVPEYSEIVPCR